MSRNNYCAAENKPCVRWAQKYFRDCLCRPRDEVSFAFGIISLVCWGVAEIPQILTNFRAKSSHGVSLLFLLTWILGDVFNLVGCLLEPATLPTQFYTALLYTASTAVLVFQGVYYDHICSWWKHRDGKPEQQVDEKKPKKPKIPVPTKSSISIPNSTSRVRQRNKEFFYTSARSLAGSGTPPFRSFLQVAWSGPAATELENGSSSDEESPPLLSKTSSLPIPIPRPAGYAAFMATSLNFPLLIKSDTELHGGFIRRKLHEDGTVHSAYGQWLGWFMAAIYTSGRLPQIWLNIKRGSVEGLNPLMFLFALVANLTYVLSIVVRSTRWTSIKPNLPWLLDAIACVALDLFIIMQYGYYRYFYKKDECTSADFYK